MKNSLKDNKIEILKIKLDLISKILIEEKKLGLANFIKMDLIERLINNEIDLFIESFYSNNVFGGSGAIWEVYLTDFSKQKELWKNLIAINEILDIKTYSNERVEWVLNFLKKEIQKTQD